MDDAAVRLTVAAGNERRSLGQLVLADLAVETNWYRAACTIGTAEGSSSRLMSQRPVSSDGGRKAGGRPACAVVGVAPGDAAEIHGVEQQRPDVDVPAVRGRGDLLGDLALGGSGRSPDNHRLAGLDQEGEDRGELARAERVVRGDLLG